MIVRHMIRSDLDRVMEIEDRCFVHCWTRDEFFDFISSPGCIGRVATVESFIVGFILYEMECTRLHFRNIAVDPDVQRSGVGTAMVSKAKEILHNSTHETIACEVSEPNLKAQLFLRSQGFKCVSILRGYYEIPVGDAYLMQYRKPAIVLEKV